jgi:glucose dehydrogenase
MKRLFVTISGVAVAAAIALAQSASQVARDWPLPLGDQGGTRFSTLAQINVSNVAALKRAWTFKTGSGRFAGAPLVVDGVMFFSAPNGVYALDATSGTLIWKYAPPETAPHTEPGAADAENAEAAGGFGRGQGRGGRGGGTAGTALRGPTYWPGTKGIAPRVYSTTAAGLAAIDAKTGTLVPSFGRSGVLPGIRPTSPAVFFKNVLIAQGDDEPGKGHTVKAWDVVTGKPLWTFYLKAQSDDANRATWFGTSGDSSASPGLWGMFTVDEARGILFVPVEKVGNDYWGGGHHGNNLYSDSLVALDAMTGKMKWHQQLVHHDIWDYDIAAPPALIEVRRNGQVIPAVVQYTKMALLFIFHRETGEPIFGMEERPVPQTTAPGEWTSPTQPFPIKPAPLARNSIKQSELAKVTPEHAAYCNGLWEKYKLSDSVPYQPWQVGQDTVVFPGAQGGGNWQGVTFHKPLGLIITNVMTAGQWGHLEAGSGRGRGRGARGGATASAAADTPPASGQANGQRADASPPTSSGQPVTMSKRTPEGGRFWDPVKKWSCSEPPWGELVAVSANTGDVAWRMPFGAFDELEAKGIKTGTPSSGGAISTAGNLVFIAATIDGMFRAFDARNGQLLWSDKLPAPGHSIPSTYMGRDGKQYVVIGATGGGYFGSPTSDELIAYSLR